MAQRGGNFRQRNEDETPFEHARMRNLQFRRIQCFVTVEKNVQIDEPRALRNGFSAPHARFNDVQGAEKVQGIEFGGAFECGIKEPVLVEIVKRFGFIDAGDTADVHAEFGEMLKRGAEVFLAFPDVGAEGDINGVHRRRPPRERRFLVSLAHSGAAAEHAQHGVGFG